MLSCHYYLIIAGISSPPVTPRQSNTSCTCVNITWDTPLFDGTAPLQTILFTFYPSSNLSQVQSLRTDSGSDTRLEICDLVPNEIYNGNISALNAVGSSEEIPILINITARGKSHDLIRFKSCDHQNKSCDHQDKSCDHHNKSCDHQDNDVIWFSFFRASSSERFEGGRSLC